MKKIFTFLSATLPIVLICYSCILTINGCTKESEACFSIDYSNSKTDSSGVVYFETRYPVVVDAAGTKNADYVVFGARYIGNPADCACGTPTCIRDTVARHVGIYLPDQGRWRVTEYAHDKINNVDSIYIDVEMRHHQ